MQIASRARPRLQQVQPASEFWHYQFCDYRKPRFSSKVNVSTSPMSNTEQNQIERRCGQRFVEFQVPVMLRAADGRTGSGFTLDLSSHGALVWDRFSLVPQSDDRDDAHHAVGDHVGGRNERALQRSRAPVRIPSGACNASGRGQNRALRIPAASLGSFAFGLRQRSSAALKAGQRLTPSRLQLFQTPHTPQSSCKPRKSKPGSIAPD